LLRRIELYIQGFPSSNYDMHKKYFTSCTISDACDTCYEII
jgi:hypothetical protein